jgi:hypothetical protein
VTLGCASYVETIHVGYEIAGEMAAAAYARADYGEVALGLSEEVESDLLVDDPPDLADLACGRVCAPYRRPAGVRRSVPVHAALCFVGANWGLFSKPFQQAGVWVTWVAKLAEMILEPGPLGEDDVQAIAAKLAHALPAKWVGRF